LSIHHNVVNSCELRECVLQSEMLVSGSIGLLIELDSEII
jgi:hypothetical protein